MRMTVRRRPQSGGLMGWVPQSDRPLPFAPSVPAAEPPKGLPLSSPALRDGNPRMASNLPSTPTLKGLTVNFTPVRPRQGRVAVGPLFPWVASRTKRDYPPCSLAGNLGAVKPLRVSLGAGLARGNVHSRASAPSKAPLSRIQNLEVSLEPLSAVVQKPQEPCFICRFRYCWVS
jgi:hypothetical protein